MWRTLKENKVSSVLLLTILIGVSSTAIDIPNTRIIHLDGSEGHRLPYAVYFITHYIVGFFILSVRLITTFTRVDKWVVINYILWDIVGFLSYIYQGWPEPKIFIVGFFTTSVVLLLMIKDISHE